jgi:hypothetical protein
MMKLREKLEIAKDNGGPIGILVEREKTELIRGTILEIGEDYCLLQPEGASFFGFSSLLVPLGGIVFLST